MKENDLLITQILSPSDLKKLIEIFNKQVRPRK